MQNYIHIWQKIKINGKTLHCFCILDTKAWCMIIKWGKLLWHNKKNKKNTIMAQHTMKLGYNHGKTLICVFVVIMLLLELSSIHWLTINHHKRTMSFFIVSSRYKLPSSIFILVSKDVTPYRKAILRNKLIYSNLHTFDSWVLGTKSWFLRIKSNLTKYLFNVTSIVFKQKLWKEAEQNNFGSQIVLVSKIQIQI